MTRSNPDAAEIREFDKQIREGQEFANRYDQDGGPLAPKAGERRIVIVNKDAGFIVSYKTIAHPNKRAVSETVRHMSTRNLMIKFQAVD